MESSRRFDFERPAGIRNVLEAAVNVTHGVDFPRGVVGEIDAVAK